MLGLGLTVGLGLRLGGCLHTPHGRICVIAVICFCDITDTLAEVCALLGAIKFIMPRPHRAEH